MYNDPTTVTDIYRMTKHIFLPCQLLSEIDAISMHLPCAFMRRPFCL